MSIEAIWKKDYIGKKMRKWVEHGVEFMVDFQRLLNFPMFASNGGLVQRILNSRNKIINICLSSS